MVGVLSRTLVCQPPARQHSNCGMLQAAAAAVAALAKPAAEAAVVAAQASAKARQRQRRRRQQQRHDARLLPLPTASAARPPYHGNPATPTLEPHLYGTAARNPLPLSCLRVAPNASPAKPA